MQGGGDLGALDRFGSDAVGEPTRTRVVREGRTGRVLELTASGGERWFAKRYRHRRGYDTEVRAHQRWVPAIQQHAPVLVERHDALRAVLLTAVPGYHPRRPALAVIRFAGQLLRSLHDAETAPPGLFGEQSASQLERQLRRCRRLGIDVDPRWLRERVGRVDDLGPLPVRSCHGDFVPRNWLVDASGSVRVVDFENAGLHTPAFDLARLMFRVAWHWPARVEALLDGYGRRLAPAELAFLDTQLALNALGMLTWATRNHKDDVVAHAHVVLRELQEGSRFEPCA